MTWFTVHVHGVYNFMIVFVRKKIKTRKNFRKNIQNIHDNIVYFDRATRMYSYIYNKYTYPQ